MIEAKEQVRLLHEIRRRRNQFRRPEYSALHRDYIRVFFKKHRVMIIGTLALFLTQGVIETLLIVISRNRLALSDGQLVSGAFWRLLILLLVLFVVNSFFSIKQEKTVVVIFVNNLRRRIFKNYLGKTAEEMSAEKQADLIAKISYHLPLVSMGASNSFFGTARWLIYLASALVVAYLAGLNIMFIGPVFLGLSVAGGGAAYLTVKRYISQEVTFYSQIIKHVNYSLSEKYFSKRFNLEPAILQKFDRLVNFDSIFRVRRDVWMKMGFKIIFALLLVISVLTNIFYDNLALRINLISPELKFLYVFLLIYMSRIAAESLRIGLYFFPAKLGLALTNIQINKYNRRDNREDIKQNIIFYSRKAKFFKTGKYYRDLHFEFQRGGRYLFYGSNLCGKTALAKLFFGGETYNPRALKVKIDGRRLDFSEYQKKFSRVHFFDPNFTSQKSLIEIIIGSDREDTAFAEIEKTLDLIARHPDLAALVSPDNNFNLSADKIWSNHLSTFALHVLHCLAAKPTLIIIDNLWLDLNYPGIYKMLLTLNRELPDSIIVAFANRKINNLDYNKCYDLDKYAGAEK